MEKTNVSLRFFIIIFLGFFIRTLINIFYHNSGDPVRYYQLFEDMYNGENVLYFIEANFDPLFIVITYVTSFFHPVVTLIFLSTAFSLVISMILSKLEIKNTLIPIGIFIILIYSDISIINYITGAFRQILSLSILIIALYVNNFFYAAIALVTSGLVHSSSLMPAIIIFMFLLYFNFGIKPFLLSLITAIFIIFFIGEISSEVYLFIIELANNKINQYIEIDYRQENGITTLKYIFVLLSLIIGLYGAFKYHKVKFDFLINVIIIFGGVSFLFTQFYSEALAIRIMNSYYMLILYPISKIILKLRIW